MLLLDGVGSLCFLLAGCHCFVGAMCSFVLDMLPGLPLSWAAMGIV